jgi:pimeloyl-ACP methyl ester carboxylesterase
MKRMLVFILSVIFLWAIRTSAQAEGDVPRFEPSECPIEVPEDDSIECGYLVTFEDYSDPEGRIIRAPIIIIHSRGENPSNEAMLFTEGGPGYSSLQSVWQFSGMGLADLGDVIILEQRGNKYAEPSLACGFSIWWDDLDGGTPCLDSLRQAGIDMEHYTTASIAADIHALKTVLNYESWNLWGSSYSTRLMQVVLDRYPEGVRSVVLQSVNPITDTRYLHDPEHAARALGVMFDDCTSDPACASAFPNLEEKFRKVVKKLNDEPVAFEMSFPSSGEQFTLEVDGGTFISFMVQNAFYGPAYPKFKTAYLPLLIDKVSSGNTELLYPWADDYVDKWGEDGYAWGLYFAVNCQDDASSITPDMIAAQIADFPELDGYFRHRDELDICAAWGLDPASPLASGPVISDIPVLVLTGRYDPITPPEWGKVATQNLSNRSYVEFPASGHSVFSDNPCALAITKAFIKDPGKKPDTSCLAGVPEPKFVLPGEIIIAPAMYEIHFDELGYSVLEENTFLASWLTLIGTGVVALVAGLVKVVRRKKASPIDPISRLVYPFLLILAVMVLVWGYALRFSLQKVASTESMILRFGLPVGYLWLFSIVLLIGLMTIILVVLSAISWKRKYWSVLGRTALSVTTLGALTFCGVLAKWGLFTALFW